MAVDLSLLMLLPDICDKASSKELFQGTTKFFRLVPNYYGFIPASEANQHALSQVRQPKVFDELDGPWTGQPHGPQARLKEVPPLHPPAIFSQRSWMCQVSPEHSVQLVTVASGYSQCGVSMSFLPLSEVFGSYKFVNEVRGRFLVIAISRGDAKEYEHEVTTKSVREDHSTAAGTKASSVSSRVEK